MSLTESAPSLGISLAVAVGFSRYSGSRAFKKLSIGNQSKVALLLALAQGAEVLILDEPTAGLDPVIVDEILRTLIEDHVSQGRTIFCVESPSG